MKKTITRGEIYFCDLGEDKGSVQGGYRPVIVMQANKLTIESSTVLVAPITSAIKRTDLFSHLIITERCGLEKNSMILFEQIRPVNIYELKDYIGKITMIECWRLITTALKKTLGLWHYPKIKSGDIRCLCSKHLDEYKQLPNYIIRRFQPTQNIRDKCDKCDNLGYDYTFFEKKSVLRKKALYESK